MGLRKSATTREYDQVDVYSMICAAMGRALVGEDSGMGTTFLRAEEMIQATTDTTPSIGRHISWKTTTNFHDTWGPTEYDRSGQISTCNHLTPLLAQQIKEELNNFKNTVRGFHTSACHGDGTNAVLGDGCAREFEDVYTFLLDTCTSLYLAPWVPRALHKSTHRRVLPPARLHFRHQLLLVIPHLPFLFNNSDLRLQRSLSKILLYLSTLRCQRHGRVRI